MLKYKIETLRSRRLLDRLEHTLPGGSTRSTAYYLPYPVVIERGSGCRIWDVDGNEYLDFLNNFASLIHGHSHPAIVEAICRQAAQGMVFTSPHALQADLAERIGGRIKSMETLRFTNSGSEAVMMCVRLARAFTGREQIVMASAGFHGTWEQICGGYQASNLGVPKTVKDLVQLVEYNNVESLESAMQAHADNVAAILFEPVLGSGRIVAGTPQFLSTARKLADKYGALLLFDEIVTSRLSLGGYQQNLGVQPDLTMLGKYIGGGLPVGAFGGSKEIMELFSPKHANCLSHSGTFNGNLLTMAAGCVALDLLTAEEIVRINELGNKLASNFSAIFHDNGIAASVRNCGSLVQLVGETQLLNQLHLSCLDEGLYFAARGYLNISTAMNESIIDEATQMFSQAVNQLGAATAVSG